MLESTSNVAFIILLWYFKGTTYFSLLIPLTVYVVILPHAFLMNTSDNKNRIVEEGWKNVFKNIFRLSKKARVNIENRSNTAEPSSTSTNKKKSTNNPKPIATISNNDNESKDVSNDTTTHSTSKNAISNNHLGVPDRPDLVNLNVKDLTGPSESYKAKQRLISIMIKCGDNEGKYMRYFKKLVVMQENKISEDDIIDIELDDEFVIKLQQSNTTKTKNSKGKGKKSKARHSSNNSPDNSQKKCETDGQIEKGYQLKGELMNRMSRRMDMINYIYSLSHDDIQHYNESIEQLIELEESFVEAD